ncbi:MAG: acetylxylan esterase [Mediterranea sp.]|jgi:cephalosporin-C deacetylase-like acetyl esterase|nr:acetylxylan esterase [Mediterranea sp.]
MKKNGMLLSFLLCFLGMATQGAAQPVQTLVQVIVSPDHPDWAYSLKENATFKIQVYKDNVLLKDAAVDYELGPEFFPTEKKQGVVLKNGELTLKSSMKEPGFLRCKVIARVDGKPYESLATAGYEVDKIRPTTPEPEDFDAFWSGAIADARKTDLDPKMVLLADKCSSTHYTYEVSFRNENPGSRIYGILTVPKKAGKYPALLRVPGAGIRPYGPEFNEAAVTLNIGIHGIPVTLPDEVYRNLAAGGLNAYWSVNMNKRDNHYYKRVFLGCVRAIDFIYSLPEFDGQTVGVTGGSQGGALSIVTAGLDPRIKFLAAYYPAMCDFSGYLNKRAGGWPHYYRSAKPQLNEVETLAYFDVVNFAKRVKAPGWYSWGFNDVTCPPTSMYAAYNVIPAVKELTLYLNTGHWTYPEQREICYEWLKKQMHL